MASSQKKAPHKRSKPGWIFSCFGFSRKPRPSQGKKGQKSGGRGRKFFRMCLPKLRINIRMMMMRHRMSLVEKTGMIMLEASKVEQLKLYHKHALITPQDQLKVLDKQIEVLQLDNRLQLCQSDDENVACDKQGRTSKTKQTTSSNTTSNVTKDSLFGLSIMLSTLIIMGIWGKLYAILCMSAWFYCAPLIFTANKINQTQKKGIETKKFPPLLEEDGGFTVTYLKGS